MNLRPKIGKGSIPGELRKMAFQAEGTASGSGLE